MRWYLRKSFVKKIKPAFIFKSVLQASSLFVLFSSLVAIVAPLAPVAVIEHQLNVYALHLGAKNMKFISWCCMVVNPTLMLCDPTRSIFRVLVWA